MSLKAIASALGLSVTTVSRALNGYDDVAEQTRLRIQQEARLRGYHPNGVARRLKMGKANAIGLMFPATPMPFNDASFIDILVSAALSLSQHEVDLLVVADDPEGDHRCLNRMIRSRYIDALIVTHTTRHDSRIATLQQLNFPFLTLGRSQLDAPYAWFDFDNYAGSRMAVDHYLARGFDRIAWLGSHHDQTFTGQRRDGYLATIARHGLPADLCWQVAPSRREGYRMTRELLALPLPPQVLITDGSLLGDGAAIALREAQRLTGADRIELMVYDGLPADSVIGEPVASIAQATSLEVGQQVASMVLQLMAGEPASALQVLWQPALNVP